MPRSKVIVRMKSIKRTILKTVLSLGKWIVRSPRGSGAGLFVTPTPMSSAQTFRPRAFRISLLRLDSPIFLESVTCFTNDLTTDFTCQPAISCLFYLLGRRNTEKNFYRPQIMLINYASAMNKSAWIVALDSKVICTNMTFTKEIISIIS